MKKNVIAVAVAAALVAPVAMADVSISGGLQAELVSVGGDGTSTPKGIYAMDGMEATYGGTATSGENGGSYGFLKFSASEDLGDGMKALAMYNFNVNVGDESQAVGGRDAYVGLSAGWGTVLAGTLSTPYKSSTVGWDPMLATSLQARGSYGMSGLHNGYAGNALAYANTFGSAKVVAAMVLDETAKAAPDNDTTYGNHAISASVNVPVGPVEVAVAYYNADKTGVPTASNKIATKVGVKWVSGDLTLAGQYESLDKGFDVDTTNKESGSVMYVTGSYAMGNNTVSAAYGQVDKKLSLASQDKAPVYMMVALNHKFSKATNAFVGYRSSDAGDNAKETAISAGLRVNF